MMSVKNMKKEAIKEHWQSWAKEYETGLRATTLSPTIKTLEVDVLYRHMIKYGLIKRGTQVLEVGCGNGHNLFSLFAKMNDVEFTGVDYSEEMVKQAMNLAGERLDPIKFLVGDVLTLEDTPELLPEYDLVICDRLLINLQSGEDQQKAIFKLKDKLKINGYLFLIENIREGRLTQTRLRESVGGASRGYPPYNLFFDREILGRLLSKIFHSVYREDFAGLHDLMLYVLIPMINEGEVDYEHPLMDAVTALSLSNPKFFHYLGGVGQNIFYACRKGVT